MILYLSLIVLYILVLFFVIYKMKLHKDIFEGTEKFTSDYLKSNQLSKKLLGILGYFIFGIFICLMFIISPILYVIKFINSKKGGNETKKIANPYVNSKPVAKEKVYPPIEIQQKYEGINKLQANKIKHPKNTLNLEPEQLLYLENEYNPLINEYFTNHWDKVQLILTEINKACKLNHKLIYWPRVLHELTDHIQPELLSYYFPFLDHNQLNEVRSDISSLQTKRFTKMVLDSMDYSGEIYPGFLRIRKNRDAETGEFNYSYVRINAIDENELEKLLWFYFSHIGDPAEHVYYQLATDKNYIKDGRTYELADFRFNYDAHKLALDIKTKIEELKHSGNQHLLINVIGQKFGEFPKSATNDNNGLSRLVINKEFKLILSDYNGLEIELTPLPKTVFLFFLRHPEGVMLKHLYDHRIELLEIYKLISYRETWDEMVRSINELIDPTKNSINEKCSRIKEAFVRHFDERLAQNYFITGDRGKEKSITLNRDLVSWQIDTYQLPEPVPSKSLAKSDEIENQANELYNAGKESLDSKECHKAIELFSKVIDLNPFHFNALSMHAVAWFDSGDYLSAIGDNDRAIELHPEINVAHHNRAESRLMIKDFDGALDDINKYLCKVNQKCAPSYFMRGLIKMELNDPRGACQDWFTAKYLGHPDAENYLRQYPKIRVSKPEFVKQSS